MWMFSNYEDLCGSYRFTPVNSMRLVDDQSAAPGLGTALPFRKPELIPRIGQGTKKTHQKDRHRSPGTGPHWLGELADLCAHVMTTVSPRWQGGKNGGRCR